MKYLLMLALCIFSIGATATTTSAARSVAAKHTFAKSHPCPATKLPTVSCKGYVIDHIKPLCAGGADAPVNMQWQKKRASYRKDGRERAYCNCLKRVPTRVCKVP